MEANAAPAAGVKLVAKPNALVSNVLDD
jgi:hypothetical protein